MNRNIVLNNLNSPQDLQSLKNYLRELYEETDVIYTTTAPNGSINARRGRLSLYNNGGTYTVWINLDGLVSWQQV